MGDAILSVENLSKSFDVAKGGLLGGRAELKAVADVSFELRAGETLGVVGESGCGKSTLGRAILRLIEPSAGRVLWRGRDLTTLDEEAMRAARRDLQIIFQDPIASLNPRISIGQAIAEPLTVFEPDLNRAARRERALEMMEAVGLAPDMLNRYPHEFSGGQAQRIAIARALIARPDLIVCDEPVSALDVSIQAQIVNLLQDLKSQFGLTLIFISHDLSVVRLVSDRIMVLYLGRVVEIGTREALFARPTHPYTEVLLSAAPVPDPKAARARERIKLKGDPPSPLSPPSGCPFRTRCPIAEARCAESAPPLSAVGEGHESACFVRT